MKLLFAPGAAALILASAVFSTDAVADKELSASAQMAGPDGTPMGIVTLTQMPDAVIVRVEVIGLTPGAHGFHVHETGACAPDFASAGDHFNPHGTGHGFAGAGPHAGDLPNIVAHADGTALAEFVTDSISLEKSAKASLFDADGSALIVHAKPDSYSHAAGAGGRVACGVIERQS